MEKKRTEFTEVEECAIKLMHGYIDGDITCDEFGKQMNEVGRNLIRLMDNGASQLVISAGTPMWLNMFLGGVFVDWDKARNIVNALKVHPQKESYWGNVNPIGFRSCYDEGKRCAETLCMDYYRQNGVRVKIIRIFNTYGPRMFMHDGRVVSNFVVQALQNEDITIYGDGSQTRSFQYVDDLVEGMLRMMETEDSFVGPVNIGNPGEFTIKELAELVIEMTGSRSKLVYKPLPADDPMQRKPEISLAKQMLHWEPKICLEEGLRKTIAYFEEELRFGGR